MSRTKIIKQTNGLSAKNGWTPQRRERQRELIASWAPWRRSTGPCTVAGKKRSAHNAVRSGDYSATAKAERRRSLLTIKAICLIASIVDNHKRMRFRAAFAGYSAEEVWAIACGTDDED